MQLKRVNVLSAFFGAALCLGAASAQALVLLDENFNDVRRAGSSCTQAMDTGTTRNVSDILGDPDCVGQLPAGTTQSGGPNQSNVRRGDNVINTTTNNSGFFGFFNPSTANNFLVLGDTKDEIGGEADGGTFIVFFPFTLASGGGVISVSFDWAFDGWDPIPGLTDNATADIVGDTNLTLLNQNSNPLESFYTPLPLSGHFSQTFLTSELPTGNLSLRFRLNEDDNTGTNTAFGIDNVRVDFTPEPAAPARIPEPATLALLGLGLLGLGFSTRRQQRA